MTEIKVQVEMQQAKLPRGWVTWYSYTDPDRLSIARQQVASLTSKGYDVRLTIDGLVEGAEPVCPLCDSAHPEPYDGSCLL